MVLVFILFGIIIILLSLFIIILLSTIQIEMVNIKMASKNIKKERKINNECEIKIKLYFLEKVPILYIKLNNNKLKKISNSKKLNNIELKKITSKMKINKKSILQMIQKLKIKLIKLNLKIDIGVEDAILTSYSVAVIAGFIAIILANLSKENINKCHYLVNPKYMNRNEYYICLDSIIRIKIVHIIYSMLFIIRKGRDENERTSNRRSYAYRYE